MKQLLLAAALGMSALVPTLAHAAGPYAGFGLVRPSATFQQDYKIAPKLFGGYDFNNNYGIEIGYTRVPRASVDSWGPDPLVRSTVTHTYRSSNAYIAGVATWSINDKFGIVTKLGVSHGRYQIGITSAPFAGPYTNESTSRTALYASIGLKYKLSEKVALTIEVEHSGRGPAWRSKPQAVTINAGYHF